MDVEMLIDKYQLTQSEASVLRLMAKNRNQLKHLGIRKLAKMSFVSSTSIVNMSKKIGYSGYSELVFAFTHPSTDLTEPKGFTKEQEIDFVNMLTQYKDKRIMILGSGFSQNLANYFSEYLNLYNFRATANSHLELLRENNKNKCLIIIVSNSGETIRLVELADIAKKNQLATIAFVGDQDSKIGYLADLTISSNTYVNKSIQKFSPNLFFGTALIQFELLMSITLKSLSEKEE